jgi:hypothetical protein
VTIRVVLEVAPKRAFASALDWPGWSRSGKDPDAALAALVAYAERYARVARRASVAFSAPGDVSDLEVVHRLTGGTGTEFGVPGAAARSEAAQITAPELKRLTALLRAAWATFDAAAERAEGVELTKGPRGGGRDLDKIVGHVAEAEAAYLGQLGARPPKDVPHEALRSALLAALDDAVAGRPFADPRNTKKPWSPRYTIRRAAWHVLDHAWEIEDRSHTA